VVAVEMRVVNHRVAVAADSVKIHNRNSLQPNQSLTTTLLMMTFLSEE
jgi:hypothetical protein